MGLLSLGKVQLPTRGGFSFATVKYPTLGELQSGGDARSAISRAPHRRAHAAWRANPRGESVRGARDRVPGSSFLELATPKLATSVHKRAVFRTTRATTAARGDVSRTIHPRSSIGLAVLASPEQPLLLGRRGGYAVGGRGSQDVGLALHPIATRPARLRPTISPTSDGVQRQQEDR
jgi:hypothetical protein